MFPIVFCLFGTCISRTFGASVSIISLLPLSSCSIYLVFGLSHSIVFLVLFPLSLVLFGTCIHRICRESVFIILLIHKSHCKLFHGYIDLIVSSYRCVLGTLFSFSIGSLVRCSIVLWAYCFALYCAVEHRNTSTNWVSNLWIEQVPFHGKYIQ
jgi:hypothetical protein